MSEYKRVIIVGAGGVGFWVSVSLVRSLPNDVELVVYDNDTFEGGLGHSRLPRVSNPATKKVHMLKGFIQVSMGDRAIKVVDGLFSGSGDQCEHGDLVVDCSDMHVTTRRTIWERAKLMGARCIRVSYDGLNETVVVAEGIPMGNPVGGYQSAPNLALSMAAGGIGALAVLRVLNGFKGFVEFQISLSDYFQPIAEAGVEAEKGLEGLSEFLNPDPLASLELGEDKGPTTPALTPDSGSQRLQLAEMDISEEVENARN